MWLVRMELRFLLFFGLGLVDGFVVRCGMRVLGGVGFSFCFLCFLHLILGGGLVGSRDGFVGGSLVSWVLDLGVSGVSIISHIR